MKIIGKTIQEISSKELFDEESVEKLLGHLVDIGKKEIAIGTDEMVSGVLTFAYKFIGNKSLCLKALKITDLCVIIRSSKSASTIKNKSFYLILFTIRNFLV